MLKNNFILFLLLLIGHTLSAQPNLDSLNSVWEDNSQPDSTRTNAYFEYVWNGFLFSNPDTSMILAQSLLSFADQYKFAGAKAKAYVLMGYCEGPRGNLDKSIGYLNLAVEIFKEIDDKSGIARSYLGLSTAYNALGQTANGVKLLRQSLKISKEIGDRFLIAKCLSILGVVYLNQGEYEKALKYIQESLSIAEVIGYKKVIMECLLHKGAIYASQEEYSKALASYKRSMKFSQEIRSDHATALALRYSGDIYMLQGNFSDALVYFNRSLEISSKLGQKFYMSITLGQLGKLYQKKDEDKKALSYCKQSLALALEIGALLTQKNACQCLYDTYKTMGHGNEALMYLEKIQVINDSLHAVESAKEIQQMEFAKNVYTDSLANVEKERIAEEAHREEVRQKERTRNIGLGIGTFFILLSGGLYRRWRYIKKSKATLQIEKDRSENLLLNILPAEVVAELKEKGKADARDFEMVSILFTDFKEFTQTSEKLNAQELVSEINTCFEAFDSICSRYKVEKIKTIGDAYMAAGGLPVQSNDSAKNTVLAALEMQHFISERKKENNAQGKPAFEMRVGIHTGPVVAGIVGVKKFQYDIWGDTVNTASRIESNGEGGKVNISQETYEMLKEDTNFTFENRGKIEVKGKGEIEMWFVEKNK